MRPIQHIKTFHAKLSDGRTVQFFVNSDTRLIVVDVIDKDEHGGVEILRWKAR